MRSAAAVRNSALYDDSPRSAPSAALREFRGLPWREPKVRILGATLVTWEMLIIVIFSVLAPCPGATVAPYMAPWRHAGLDDLRAAASCPSSPSRGGAHVMRRN